MNLQFFKGARAGNKLVLRAPIFLLSNRYQKYNPPDPLYQGGKIFIDFWLILSYK
jgi:hypothetical protein